MRDWLGGAAYCNTFVDWKATPLPQRLYSRLLPNPLRGCSEHVLYLTNSGSASSMPLEVPLELGHACPLSCQRT